MRIFFSNLGMSLLFMLTFSPYSRGTFLSERLSMIVIYSSMCVNECAKDDAKLVIASAG